MLDTTAAESAQPSESLRPRCLLNPKMLMIGLVKVSTSGSTIPTVHWIGLPSVSERRLACCSQSCIQVNVSICAIASTKKALRTFSTYFQARQQSRALRCQLITQTGNIFWTHVISRPCMSHPSPPDVSHPMFARCEPPAAS